MIAVTTHVQASVHLHPDVELCFHSHGQDGARAAFVTIQIGPDLNAVTIFCREVAYLDRLTSVLADAKAALLGAQTKVAA